MRGEQFRHGTSAPAHRLSVGVNALEEAREVPREDADTILIGGTTYEIASVYAGKAALLDLVKAALERDARQALRSRETAREGGAP